MPATGTHAPWRLWILIVLWVLQLILLIVDLALYIIAVVAVGATDDWDHDFKGALGVVIAIIAVNMTLCVVSLALTIAEIVMLARYNLKPVFYLISNVLKAAVWVGLTVYGLIGSRDDYNGYRSGLTIVVTIIMLLCFVLPMIYGIIVFVKSRRSRGVYKNVDPSQHTAYNSAAQPHLELESGFAQREYDHQRDPRFEAYRQSIPAVAPSYGYTPDYAETYDNTTVQKTGYVS